MGFFSWKTQDTNESIANSFSNRATFTVYMTDNVGNRWREDNYEGYGTFGGKDYYECLAEMNGLASDRDLGIELAFDESKICIYPNLNESGSIAWKNEQPENCDFQGYFYYDEDEDEDDDWEEDDNDFTTWNEAPYGDK